MMNGINAFEGVEHQPFLFEGTSDHAVLLVHGFPGSAKEMRPLAEAIKALGWTAKGVLLPGFGPEIETIEQKSHVDWENHVDTALLELKKTHTTVVIIGNSMGGALSIQAVARHHADGLILFAPFWTIDHFLWKALPVLKHVIRRFKPFSLFKPDFQDPEFQKGTKNFFPNADFDDPEFQRQTLEMEINTNVFDQIRAAGQGGYELAPQVNVPTLVIQGKDDELVKPQVTQQLLNRLGGPLEYLEVDAPHNPLSPDKDYWSDVVSHVEAYLQRLP